MKSLRLTLPNGSLDDDELDDVPDDDDEPLVEPTPEVLMTSSLLNLSCHPAD